MRDCLQTRACVQDWGRKCSTEPAGTLLLGAGPTFRNSVPSAATSPVISHNFNTHMTSVTPRPRSSVLRLPTPHVAPARPFGGGHEAR